MPTSKGRIADNGNPSIPGYGIYSRSTNSLTMTGTEFAHNQRTGLQIEAMASPASLAITDANFHDMQIGLFLNSPEANAAITNSTFANNVNGVEINANIRIPVKIRGSIFTGHKAAGIMINRGAGADLGTTTSPGSNTINVNDKCAGIFDRRDTPVAPTNVFGNSWTGASGQQPSTGCSTKSAPYPNELWNNFWTIQYSNTATCSSATSGTGNVFLN